LGGGARQGSCLGIRRVVVIYTEERAKEPCESEVKSFNQGLDTSPRAFAVTKTLSDMMQNARPFENLKEKTLIRKIIKFGGGEYLHYLIIISVITKIRAERGKTKRKTREGGKE